MNTQITIGNMSYGVPIEIAMHINDLKQQVATLTKALDMAVPAPAPAPARVPAQQVGNPPVTAPATPQQVARAVAAPTPFQPRPVRK